MILLIKKKKPNFISTLETQHKTDRMETICTLNSSKHSHNSKVERAKFVFGFPFQRTKPKEEILNYDALWPPLTKSTPSFKSSSIPRLNKCAAVVTTAHFRPLGFFTAFNLLPLLPFLFPSTDDVDDDDVDSSGTTNGISKLVRAFDPLNRLAAASYARAASSAVSNVPSQCLHRPIRSRISADHRPHGRFRTPL